MVAKKKVAQSRAPIKKPRNPEKAILAAWFLMLGYTLGDAASHASCSVSILHNWRRSEWWPRAMEEARRRWGEAFVGRVKRGLLQALDDPKEYAATARWGADRVIDQLGPLAPPRVRGEITGKDGDPIEITTEVVFVDSPKDSG